MFALFTCLEQHDPKQLVWAVLICVISVGAGLNAYGRARQAHGGLRLVWLALLAFLLGAGVWATHFMAMLAFHRHTAAAFGLAGTAASLVTAAVGFFAGAGVAACSKGRLGRAAGGGVCGLAIAAMHFVGVAAMRLPATIVWNPLLVVVAILIAVAGAAAAFTVAGDFKRRFAAFGAAALLVAAICGLHFTAMAAATLIPAPFAYAPGFYSREGLGLAVGLLVGVILISGGGVLLMDGVSKATALSALRASLNQVPCAIGFFDSSYRLIFWNESFADFMKLYGLEPRVGLDHDAALAKAQSMGLPVSVAAQADLGNSAPDGKSRFEQFRAPNGRWFEARRGTSRDGGLVALITDVTAQRELMEQQAQARAAAEQVSRAKSEFLANTSHEIRTPLNALLGMVQVMERNDLDPDQRKRLQLVAESGKSLLGVLNSVLDLAKIEAGKFELDEHPFDLVATVGAAVSAFESLAAQKELNLAVEIAPAAAGVWRGDGDRLRQVLTNLLSNAVKFTPLGHVAVRVDCGEGGLLFRVEDSGIGVAADKQEVIFDAFEQADASTTRQFGGTGLGLAICASILRSMGGWISLESAPGEGSVFTFVVPMARVDSVGAPGVAAAPDDTEELPLRILVAEDNPNNQLVLSALLEPFGVALTITDDGQAAVEAFAVGTFDVVLMDAQMPRMNGVEAAREIRRIEAARGQGRIRIIALTANVMNHQVQEYLAAGMDDFIAKPIQLGELVAALSAAPAQATCAAA